MFDLPERWLGATLEGPLHNCWFNDFTNYNGLLGETLQPLSGLVHSAHVWENKCQIILPCPCFGARFTMMGLYSRLIKMICKVVYFQKTP